MMQQLKTNSNRLIVVINGTIASRNRVEEIADNVFIRENIGYDIGAYKELFLGNFFPIYEGDWDEIVLVNDSIFGPIYDLKEIFSHMDKLEVDCWGLGRYEPDGIHNIYMQSESIPEHLQSFFLAFRRNMVESVQFKKYWREMEYPLTYDEAVGQAEFKQMRFIKTNGYTYTSWMDEKNCSELIHTIAVYDHILELVSEFRFPVIKRKFFVSGNYLEAANNLLMYLCENTGYDVSLIKEAIKRLSVKNELFGTKRLMEFVNTHDKLYIFGHGMHGNNTAYYLNNMQVVYEGFVVSSPDNDKDYCLEELSIGSRDGVIVAVGERWLPEVKDILLDRFGKDRIIFPL